MNKQRLALILTSFLIAALWRSSAAFAIQSEPSGDLLVYSVGVSGDYHTTHLYDPAAQDQTVILEDYHATSLKFSVDGRLAFANFHDRTSELYMVDLVQGDSPINLNDSLNMDAYAVPLDWSPNGSLLAFYTQSDDERRLYIWDGTSALDVTPEGVAKDVAWYEIAWSHDGHLAITAQYEFGYEPDRSEIFAWDGKTTFNLSRNPGRRDSGAAWSNDGRLAFISAQTDWNNLYIWDPQQDTKPIYVPVSANLYITTFDLTWTNDGRLAFSAQGLEDNEYQVYLWDGENAVDFTQVPTRSNIDPRWSADGHWAFVNVFSDEQNITIRDSTNNTLLVTDGDFAPAWSAGGLLIFCTMNESDWALRLWDGAEVTTIGRGEYVEAQWRGGAGVNCTSG